MKKLRKKALNINGILFNIYSLYSDEIEKYFKEFIVPCDSKITATYNIYFEKDEQVFLGVYKNFNKSSATVIDTFKQQQHFREDNKFLIDTEEYICVKKDDYNFMLFTNGSSKSFKNLIRIIRELLIRELESMGYFYMHGTGIEIYDKGILLLGGSGSGKTTFATKLNGIDSPQKFLSNDRVFVKKDKMLYYPLPIVYAMGTAKNDASLDRYFRETNALEIRRGGNYEIASPTTKCDIPLLDIEEIFPHISSTSSLDIDVVIFPKLSSTIGIRELSSFEKNQRLNENNFTPNDIENERREWLKNRIISLEQIKENKKKQNRFLIQNKPIVEMSYTVDSTKEEIIKELKKVL